MVLTGPNRAVVMNESVIIEAELKVKGPDDEDIYVFAQAAKIKKKSTFGVREITFDGRCGIRGVPKPVRAVRPHRAPKIEAPQKYKIYLMYNNIGGFNFVNFQLNP